MRQGTLQLGAWVVCLVASPAALAQLQYDFVEIGYTHTEFDVGSVDPDGDGFDLRGAFKVHDKVFLFGEYTSAELDFNIDFTLWQVGAGYRYPTSNTSDIVGTVSFVDVEADTSFGSADDDGFGLSLGYRSEFLFDWEVGGFIEYLSFDESTTSVSGYGRYFITPEASVGLDVSLGEDLTTFGVNLRYGFR